MGRPIKKKFFGNLNAPYNNYATNGTTGEGGESIASIAVSGAPGTGWTTGTLVTISGVSTQAQLAGGISATGITVVTGSTLSGITLVTSGTGFISTSSNVFTFASSGTIGTAAFTIALTTGTSNALQVYAYIPTGTQGDVADIIKQESSRRYRVQTLEGAGTCRLASTSTLAAGQMYIIATDVNGSTYFVNKLSARKALLSPYQVNGSFEYGSLTTSTRWSINPATAGIVSIAHTI